MIRATRAEKQAREHATTAERVSDFLIGLFEVNDPSEARGKTITAREVLDKGVKKIEAELKDEPEIRARLLGTLGKVHSGLGLSSDAIRFLETAWEHDLRLARLPDTPLSESLAWAYVLAGRYADAERVHLATIERARKEGSSIESGSLPPRGAEDRGDRSVGRSLSVYPHGSRSAALAWLTQILFFLAASSLAREDRRGFPSWPGFLAEWNEGSY